MSYPSKSILLIELPILSQELCLLGFRAEGISLFSLFPVSKSRFLNEFPVLSRELLRFGFCAEGKSPVIFLPASKSMLLKELPILSQVRRFGFRRRGIDLSQPTPDMEFPKSPHEDVLLKSRLLKELPRASRAWQLAGVGAGMKSSEPWESPRAAIAVLTGCLGSARLGFGDSERLARRRLLDPFDLGESKRPVSWRTL